MAPVEFNWVAAPNQDQRNGAICEVPGVGRLYARRRSPRGNQFVGYIGGNHAIPATTTMAKAKADLEAVALRWLAAKEES